MSVMAWRIRYDRARNRPDGGFSLVEVTVTIMVFSIVALFMAGIMSGTLRGIMLSRQRAVATADANDVLETARSLAFADVGLASNDPTLNEDLAITTIGPTNRLYGGEPIVFAQNPTGHPFNPHIQTVQRGPTTLTRAIYVTGLDTSTDGVSDVSKVTVVVSWDRSPVPSVANSVTASTIISPSSPGTLGNPPLGAPGGSFVPPLSGVATARGPNVLVEADIGLGALLGSLATVSAGLNGAGGTGRNTLSASSSVTCRQEGHSLEASVAGIPEATNPVIAANSANSVSNPGPHDTGPTGITVSTASILPNLLTLPGSLLQGSARCKSSAVTSSNTLPSMEGEVSSHSSRIRVDTAIGSLLGSLGQLDLVDLSAGSANQSVTQSTVGGQRQMTSSAQTSFAGIRLLRQTSGSFNPTSLLNLGAPDGVVQVLAFDATATTTANAEGGSTPAVSVNQPLRLRLWHGQGSNPSSVTVSGNLSCSNANGYCTIQPLPNSQGTIEINRTVELGSPVCLPLVGCLSVAVAEVTVQTLVSVDPASYQTITLGDGVATAYRTQYNPITVETRLRLSGLIPLAGLGPKADVRVSLDVGEIMACTKHGIFPGGC